MTTLPALAIGATALLGLAVASVIAVGIGVVEDALQWRFDNGVE